MRCSYQFSELTLGWCCSTVVPRLPVARQLFASPSASSWALSLTTQQHYRHASSRSSSSSQWLQRQRSDPFVRARSTGELDPSSSSADAFVSRSAFKLVELQQKSRGALLRPGMCVVDLGAAPGGWVQAAQRELSSTSSKGRSKQRGGVIVGVDLLPLHASVVSLPGVSFVRGDFLDPLVQAEVVTAIAEARGGAGTTARVDLVLSDMLANLTGNLLRDAQLSLDLCEAALAFALDHLAPPPASPSPSATGKRNKRGPSLVMKCLQSSLSPAFQDVLKEHFEGVAWSKPSSSRPESREGYWVCSGLRSGRGKEQDSWEDGEGGEGDGIYF